jgi:hypothetical protein
MSIAESPTWKLLEQRWDQGFDGLLPEEKEAIALWWLEAETMNGTLNQFFWNGAGDLALIAQSGLKRLGMPVTLRALQAALDYFGASYPVDRELRMAQLEEIEDVHGADVFTPASRIIQDLPEDFVQAAVDRLEKIYKAEKIYSRD